MKSYLLKISNLLTEKKVEKQQLAKLIEKTPQTISNYLSERSIIDVDTFIKIANALNSPVSYFFEEKESKPYPLHSDKINISSDKQIEMYVKGGIHTQENNSEECTIEKVLQNKISDLLIEKENLKKEIEYLKKINEMLEKQIK